MSKTTTNAAMVLDAAYVQARNAAVATGGAFSAAACKAATVAFNRAIVNHSIFEFQDLETTIKTMPSATRQGLRRAVTACFALAFGEESADRRGSTVFTVKECDCNAARREGRAPGASVRSVRACLGIRDEPCVLAPRRAKADLGRSSLARDCDSDSISGKTSGAAVNHHPHALPDDGEILRGKRRYRDK